jgi:hypothetical protein
VAPASLPAPFLFEDLPIPALFHIPCLFETDSGTDLFVTEPLNRPKDGIGYHREGLVALHTHHEPAVHPGRA